MCLYLRASTRLTNLHVSTTSSDMTTADSHMHVHMFIHIVCRCSNNPPWYGLHVFHAWKETVLTNTYITVAPPSL